ncbi:hypothetical protein POF50_021440 [Streptomyces sp. SL13]|uniref:Uncharacterized protein n=1 Tax=Streptantibioticus silvisoli TaxID=2705255 RepID=A0AA90KHI4_9ACTN|nr:hypothetical protein [Streptantibioticus silvisoli]MDI5971865.1 hypothetical protein [Streptantibioticus silvisoli]
MNSSKPGLLAQAAMVTGCGAMAALTGVDLDSYHLPLAWNLSCSTAVFSALLHLTTTAAAAWGTRTHRCPLPDCDFTVRLQHVDAGENRRWQEIAAHHPHTL